MFCSQQKEVECEHLVQFYENDTFLIDGLTDFIGSALSGGDAAVVIATRTHLAALEENLRERCLMPDEPCANHHLYLPLDAETLIPQFMVGDLPDEERFTRVIGKILDDVMARHSGSIFVFGEMVAILCGEERNSLRSEGKHEAAIHVEACFNKLLKGHRISLLCGYPMGAFPREEDAKAFHEVCALHTSVIPTEKYNALDSVDVLQRSIASLQQKAFSLVTEVNQRLLVEQALRDVNFDKLTGLPNRTVFQDRLEMEIRKAHRTRSSFALLFIDLDHFKEINDNFGHATGDVMLEQVARRLVGSVRENDTVARLGGDEFTVILSDIDADDPVTVSMVAENIRSTLLEPFHLGNDIGYISASIGITLCPLDATTVIDLLRNADQAMYAAKDVGRNGISFFTRSMQVAAQKRLKLTNELRSALPGNQLRMFYQPIVDLATDEIHKAEALLRWQHPQGGLISPVEFIPIAEHTGMIGEIGEWVFYAAVRQATLWRKFDPAFQISINVSPAQFQRKCRSQFGWVEFLKHGKRMQRGTTREVSLEITEGLLLDATSSVTSQLLGFRDAGIQVSLDDFGTGYSSLSYLRKFDIDYLKIDQSFVRDLDTNPDNQALCEAMIVMAHKLGLKVIAEGVESKAQSELLRQAGCDYAQGFFFSQPVPALEFEKLLH